MRFVTHHNNCFHLPGAKQHRKRRERDFALRASITIVNLKQKDIKELQQPEKKISMSTATNTARSSLRRSRRASKKSNSNSEYHVGDIVEVREKKRRNDKAASCFLFRVRCFATPATSRSPSCPLSSSPRTSLFVASFSLSLFYIDYTRISTHHGPGPTGSALDRVSTIIAEPAMAHQV
jgi:hypothetical protein